MKKTPLAITLMTKWYYIVNPIQAILKLDSFETAMLVAYKSLALYSLSLEMTCKYKY